MKNKMLGCLALIKLNGNLANKEALLEKLESSNKGPEKQVIKLPRTIICRRICYTFSKTDISSYTAKQLNDLIIFLKHNSGTDIKIKFYTDKLKAAII